jgi:oxygen-independent coproporphyrinogen-3 oxidase
VDRKVIPLRVAIPRAAQASGVAGPLPLALYVHFPWCVRKCPYCDFNSHEARGAIPEADYVDALIADLELALPQVWGRRVASVFIGGGTPSLMAAESVGRLLAAIRARLNLLPDAEITLEANPGTVEAARFAAYRDSGINRISLGIQSFDDTQLAALGRIHDAREAHAAIALALAHFENVNLDLMYALPGQTLKQAQRDIEAAASYRPSHVSVYHLTLEPNTPFHRAPPPLPDGDLAADMQDTVERVLGAAGYRHYETSAFALPGSACRHNLNYWQFGDYLGIGAGAHGKLSSHEGIRREMRHRHPQAYIEAVAAAAPVQEGRDVGRAELPFEFMMNALRLNQGFPATLYAERTGLTLAGIHEQLLGAQRRGLLEVEADRIAPTERGRRFLNDLLEIFLSSQES